MNGKDLFDATEYIGADLIHRAEFAKVRKSHWKQVLSTAAVFVVLLGAGVAALYGLDSPSPVVPTPPDVSDTQPPTVPTEPDVPDTQPPTVPTESEEQTSPPKLVTDERYGVTMAVPEPLQDTLVITPPFSFTLNRPVEEPGQENRLWFLEIAARNDGQSPEEIYNWSLWSEDFKLGWDDTYFYLLHVPPLTEAAEETRTSLLLGFQTLRDFLERNDITPNPNWETAYLRHISDFWTQPFDSAMDTAQTDDALRAYSSRISNLEYYVWDEPEPLLTWEDLLVYRLATADFTQVTDDPEGLQQFLFSHVLPYSEEGYDGGNPDIPDQFRWVLDQLHRHHLWLRTQKNLPELCSDETWKLDKTWTLHCGDTEVRLPDPTQYSGPDDCMLREDMDIARALVEFSPNPETDQVYHSMVFVLSNRQIQEMKTLFEKAELTIILTPEEAIQHLTSPKYSISVHYADGTEDRFYSDNSDSSTFYRYTTTLGVSVNMGKIRAVNPALTPWIESIIQQTSRESH